MTIGECIKSLRQAAGFMQVEFARRLGISASMLSLVEAGKREPTLGFLRQVAAELGVPAAVLFVAALSEDDALVSPEARQLRQATMSLFEAAKHSLAAKRVRNDADDKPSDSKRSA